MRKREYFKKSRIQVLLITDCPIVDKIAIRKDNLPVFPTDERIVLGFVGFPQEPNSRTAYPTTEVGKKEPIKGHRNSIKRGTEIVIFGPKALLAPIVGGESMWRIMFENKNSCIARISVIVDAGVSIVDVGFCHAVGDIDS